MAEQEQPTQQPPVKNSSEDLNLFPSQKTNKNYLIQFFGRLLKIMPSKQGWWELLKILLVPLALGGATIYTNIRINEVGQKIQSQGLEDAKERKQEEIQNAYIDYFTDLMLKQSPNNPAGKVTRKNLITEKTRIIWNNLNRDRQRQILEFLINSNIVVFNERANATKQQNAQLNVKKIARQKNDPTQKRLVKYTPETERVVTLKKFVFSGLNLRRVNLNNVDLREANLSGADLWGADLSNADLSGANLSNADLSTGQKA